MTSTPNGPGLRRNLTLLCVYHALMMSLFPMAIITLYQQHELGLSMTEIMGLQAIFGVALAVFEFPSGYAADRLGYRASLLAAAVLSLGGWLVYAQAGGFWGVAAAETLALPIYPELDEEKVVRVCAVVRQVLEA